MTCARKRRGSNAMEFALVAPVLVLVVTGIIDFGWYFFAQQSLSNATLDAARFASLTTWEDSPSSTAEGELEALLAGTVLDSAHTKVSATYSGQPPAVKLNVEVASEYPVLLGLLPLPSTVGSEMTLVLEDQPSAAEYEGEGRGSGDDD